MKLQSQTNTFVFFDYQFDQIHTTQDSLGKRVRFHLFRKVVIFVGRNMIGLRDDQIKMLTGKVVKADMDPHY